MTQICLQSPSVGGQCEAGGMAQHVLMHLEGHLGLDAGALNQFLKATDREWRSTLRNEHEW